MRHHQKLKDLAKRLEISAYVPPDQTCEIAEKRTSGMVHYFHALMRESSWEEAYRHIQTLANSCYLQGVTDAAVANGEDGEG